MNQPEINYSPPKLPIWQQGPVMLQALNILENTDLGKASEVTGQVRSLASLSRVQAARGEQGSPLGLVALVAGLDGEDLEPWGGARLARGVGAHAAVVEVPVAGIFVFLNYLPYSKHLHIILAFPNAYYTRLLPKGKMKNMPEVQNEVQLRLTVVGCRLACRSTYTCPHPTDH